MFRIIFRVISIITTIFITSACDDNMLQRNSQATGATTLGGDGRPGGLKPNPGESYRFPEIIETEFIPPYEFFAETKCLTWRITWPQYDSDYSSQYIPTVLSLNNGELNSFNFLNGTHPQNTHNSTISLYYHQEVKSANIMWDELDHSFDTDGYEEMLNVNFEESSVSLETLMDWVTKRPDLFKHHYPVASFYNELKYEEGDFIQFHITKAELYGGIRIVSMTPRIIEVYLAVPIDWTGF